MRKLLFIFFLILGAKAYASVPLPRGSTGFEVGVARLSDSKSSMIGPSWSYNFDFQSDKILSFFGQAGSSWAKENSVEFKQNAFTGGVELDFFSILSVRLGVATTLAEIKRDDSIDRHQEMGPMVGGSISIPVGVFTLGSTATIIRTKSLHSTALRAMLLISF